MISMRLLQVGIGAVLVGMSLYLGSDTIRDKVSSLEIFGADGITPAKLEQMHIESSGVTVDTVPVSQVGAFMGWQQLHLGKTTSVANDSPFMDGVVDSKPVYQNPFDVGYTMSQEAFGAETQTFNSLWVGDSNKDTAKSGKKNKKDNGGEQKTSGWSRLLSRLNPEPKGDNSDNPKLAGDGGVTSFEASGSFVGQETPTMYDSANPPELFPVAGSPYRVQVHDGSPVYSLDPSTGVDGIPIAYQGATPVARIPPEVNRDFPYMVSLINVPFKQVPSAEIGSNRFGSLARNSTDDNINGRFGETALTPEVDASYTASSGETMPLSQWRTKYTVLRHSDTMVSAIPFSGGPELQLRRV
ncbi:MAG: hypothetical protein ACTSPB_05230 [Candidatus Thorarchaeota archaeon]